MEIATLIIAVVALVIAVLAYRRTGGIQDLRNQVKAVGPTTETLRAKTADALDRLERAVRGSREETPPSTPGASEKGTEEQEKKD
jgi:HAMP domain-containing protein